MKFKDLEKKLFKKSKLINDNKNNENNMVGGGMTPILLNSEKFIKSGGSVKLKNVSYIRPIKLKI